MKRLLSMLLSMAIVVSSFAPTAYAAETAAEDHSHDPAVQQTLETIPATELVTETAETVVSSADLPSNDELFSLYVDSKLYGREISTFGTAARESLNDAERGIYDYLKEKIQYVAANGGSTEFSISDLSALSGVKYQWTNEELGVTSIEGDAETAVKEAFAAQYDLGKIVDALLHDCPYDLYWYDKTTGCTSTYKCSFSGQNTDSGTVWNKIIFKDLVFKFYVSSNYDGAQDNLLDVNTDVSKVSTAAANANDVVNTYSELPDLEKLTNYRDYICGAVSYNHDAAVNGDFASDNDPWQLIWVFDGDESTNVVCEGYAKAFQHLCDLTQFKNAVCYTASGTMAGGTGAGGHMWNIVTMDDGKSYLVDITNSDEGTVGHGGGLFLDGVSGSVENGYVATAGGQSIVFKYDNDTVDILSNDVLTLSDTKYTEPAAVYTITAGQCTNGTIEVDKTVAENGETVTVTATPDQCYTLSTIYVNGAAISGNTFAATEDAVVTATFAVKHTEEYIPAIKADCQTEGFTAGVKCSVCDAVITAPESVGFGDHSFTNYVSDNNATCEEDGTKTATCDHCDATDTQADENSALGHTETEIPAIKADCQTEGFTAGTKCSVCGTVITAPVSVGFGDHSFTNYVSDNNATCEEDGTKTATCDRCDATDTQADENSALGHSFTEYISNGDGTETSTCDNGCGTKDTRDDGTSTARGTCGKNASWILYSDGELVISGTGDMADFMDGAPWADHLDSIKKITVNDGITSIGACAFSGCVNLKEISLPETLVSIEVYALSYCENLSYIYIPASVTSIGGIVDGYATGAFGECPLLKTAGPKGSGCNIEFGWTTAIPQGAFCDCFYLESVTIPDGITTIGNSAFAYCEGLTDIYMPDSVTSVGYDAFLYCTGLKNIRLSQNLTSISDGMFFYCPGLTQIYIPDSVTSIGSNAFEWCENLSNINIPLSVTKIGNFAFCNCYELTELSYAGSVAEWNNVQCGDAFDTATGSYPTIYCEKGYSGIQRIYGATRFETSYAIADATLYAQGVEKVDTIIVANGMNFADALAGSYLAKVKNAPILMAGPENVSQISHYVSQRLNTGGTVYILGGVNAVSPMVESHLNALTDISLKVVRLAGATRFETNIEILKEAGVTNEEILVCTAYDFADSLSAAAAGKPILLVDTEKDQLNAAQKDYLNSLSGNSFCIVGGVNAVSPKLENQLSAYGTISRLAGATRYETSVMVAEKYIKNPEYAVFAYALNFPDGLCGGSLALSLNAPLILTKAGDDAAAQRYVQSNGIKYGYVLGGSSLVSDAAVNNIYGLPVNTPVSQW